MLLLLFATRFISCCIPGRVVNGPSFRGVSSATTDISESEPFVDRVQSHVVGGLHPSVVSPLDDRFGDCVRFSVLSSAGDLLDRLIKARSDDWDL